MSFESTTSNLKTDFISVLKSWKVNKTLSLLFTVKSAANKQSLELLNCTADVFQPMENCLSSYNMVVKQIPGMFYHI